MRKYIFAALAFFLALALNADVIQGLRNVNKIMQQIVPPEEQAAAQETQAQVKKPKYIFYFIGDGMGINQVQMGIDYKAQTTGGKEELNMQKFPIMGANRTYCANKFVTDSSASGTALATGHKTNYGVAGIDVNGDAIDSIAVYCHNRGMKVGTVHANMKYEGEKDDIQKINFIIDAIDGSFANISKANGRMRVYNSQGMLSRDEKDPETALRGLRRGMYIINGKKVTK